MAKEVLELEVKTNVSGAKQEMDKLGSSVNNAETELKELNEQLEIQVEVVNKLETALLEMKQQQSVNSDYENSVSRLNERIKETTMELALEKQGLKTLKRERSVTIKNVKDLEKAQKAQIKQAFAGIKHFNIMGVSLRRLRLMTRAVIPGFKLMFKTIKTGIASTGIGLIVIALASIGTALARTGKGAKAFKAILAGLREVVNFLLKPLELAGDALLSLFGVDDAPAVDVVAQMKSEIESLNNSLGDIELQQIKNKAANRENQKIVDDVTKSEEERLAALEKIFNTNKSTQQQTLANLERQVVLQTEVARKAKSAHDWHKQGGAAQETINKLKKEQVNEENNLIALQKKLANLKDEMLVAEDDFEKNIAEVKSFNINQEKEREKELAAQRKKFREQRENGEKKIAAIILKLQQEAAGAPPGGPGMPPGIPPGMPPGMPVGGMPPGMPMNSAVTNMPPGAGPPMPSPNPGGQGVGIRNRGPARPEMRNSFGIGSPNTSVQQRGPQPTSAQRNQQRISSASRPRGA